MTITLWMEGYSATGEAATATSCGTFEADSLVGAVQQWVARDPRERTRFTRYEPHPSFWGCRFYDNEVEARKAYG